MDVRRLLTTVGAGLVCISATAVGFPSAALAAPAAPKGLSVARTSGDVNKIAMSWKSQTDADHYVVDVTADSSVQTVTDVPATTPSYTIDSQSACTGYKMRVGAADAAGTVTYTGYTFVKSLVPGYIGGVQLGREEDGTVATAKWNAPAWTGYTPITAYHVVFTRNADGIVLADYRSLDTSFRFPGVDAGKSYTLQVTTENQYGACNTAKSLMDRFRPADPTDLVVQRRSDSPSTVEVIWKGSAGTPEATYYQVGYGETKASSTTKVDAAQTSTTLTLDTSKAWYVEVKAYNGNGGSGALTGTVPVYTAPAATTPTTTVVSSDPTPTATATPAPTASTGSGSGSDSASTTPGDEVEGTTTSTTVTTGSDRTPPVITASIAETKTNGWYKDQPTVKFSCTDNSGAMAVCPANVKVTTEGAAQRVTGTAKDEAGNTTTISLAVNVDTSAPSVTATVQGTKNANGWYTAIPTIHYTCADTVSGVKTCPNDTPITLDGEGQRVTGTVTDKAGNTATATVLIDLDKIAPVVTATVVGDGNNDGWYTKLPTVKFTCTDGGSGIADCPTDRKITTEGAAQEIVGTATDKAGNTASAKLSLNVDLSAPTITAEIIGKKVNGWYSESPTIHFTCSDTGSGISFCPADQLVSTNGAAQRIAGTARDKAGNIATAFVSVSVDRIAPTLSYRIEGQKNANGWYNQYPSIYFTCTDEGGSDISTSGCPMDSEIMSDGEGVQFAMKATDNAGNSTQLQQVGFNIDTTAPEITAEIIGEKNEQGWYKTAPVVHFTCSDETSGIVECPADVQVDADDVNRLVMGTVSDKAGNVGTTSVVVNLDQTVPTVTATVVGDASEGWYKSAPTVKFTCTDDGSAVASCPDDVKVSTDGADQVVSGVATDNAGNSATTAVKVSVDQIAPKITSTITGTKSSSGWYTSTPSVHFDCADSVSKVKACTTDQVISGEGSKLSVPGTASDKAGNAATDAITVNVDKTAPVVSVVGAVAGQVFKAGSNPVVSCNTTDAASGVATAAALTHTFTSAGLHTLVCAGAVDKAGNKANAVSLTYTVQNDVAWLIQLTHEYGTTASTGQLTALDNAVNKGQYISYIAQVLALSLGKKPVFSAVHAVTLIYWANVLKARS